MSFYTDNFNRDNEDPIASPWTTRINGVSDLRIVSNVVYGETDNNDSDAYYSGGTFTGSQFSQVQIAVASLTDGVGVWARLQAGAHSGYAFYWSVGAGAWKLRRVDAGSFQTSMQESATPSPSQNDTIKIEASGSTIKGYVNGVLVCSGTDSTYSTGYPGIKCNDSADAIDNWAGGDIAYDQDLRFVIELHSG